MLGLVKMWAACWAACWGAVVPAWLLVGVLACVKPIWDVLQASFACTALAECTRSWFGSCTSPTSELCSSLTGQASRPLSCNINRCSGSLSACSRGLVRCSRSHSGLNLPSLSTTTPRQGKWPDLPQLAHKACAATETVHSDHTQSFQVSTRLKARW